MVSEMAKINKSVPGAIRVRTTQNGNQFIYIRFYGDKKFIATGMSYSVENMLLAEKYLKTGYLKDKAKAEQKHIESFSNKYQLQDAIQSYLDYCKSKNLKKSTIRNYIFILKTVFKNANYDVNTYELTRSNIKRYRLIQDIEEFLSNNSNQKNNTSNGYFNVTQTFFKYLFEENLTNDYLHIKTRYKKVEQEHTIQTYTQEALEKLFISILTYPKKKFRCNAKLKRYDLMLYFLFLNYTGARRVESSSLKWEQVSFEKKHILFYNKINKSKIDYFPIYDKLLRLLKILKKLADERNDKEYVFLFRAGDNYAYIIKKLNKKLNIEIVGKALHAMRSTFATKLFDLRDEGHIDTGLLLEIIRHKDKRTTDEHYRQYKTIKMAKKLSTINL
jgi:integrase